LFRIWGREKGERGAAQEVLLEANGLGVVGVVIIRLMQFRHVGVRPRTGAAIVMCQWPVNVVVVVVVVVARIVSVD